MLNYSICEHFTLQFVDSPTYVQKGLFAHLISDRNSTKMCGIFSRCDYPWCKTYRRRESNQEIPVKNYAPNTSWSHKINHSWIGKYTIAVLGRIWVPYPDPEKSNGIILSTRKKKHPCVIQVHSPLCSKVEGFLGLITTRSPKIPRTPGNSLRVHGSRDLFFQRHGENMAGIWNCVFNDLQQGITWYTGKLLPKVFWNLSKLQKKTRKIAWHMKIGFFPPLWVVGLF